MKTEIVTHCVVESPDRTGVAAPPARLALPSLSTVQPERVVNALHVLLKHALGMSQIQVAEPEPPRPEAPKVHERPRSWFD